MTHKRIAVAALNSLGDDRAEYFSDIANRLEEDPRAEGVSNMVFLTLKETMVYLPTSLPKKEFISLLFDFIGKNRSRMNRLLFDARFVHDPSCIRAVTNDFINVVVDVLLEHFKNGQVESGEKTVYTFQWPHYDTPFPHQDDDPNDI